LSPVTRPVPSGLRDVPGLRDWLGELAELGPPPDPLVLPAGDELAALLDRLGVPAAEIPDAVAARPAPEADPDRWWALERSYHRLTAGLGTDDPATAGPAADGRGPFGAWPPSPSEMGPGWEWFFLHLYAAAAPAVADLHARWGLPPEVTWATLGNVGRNVGLHRRTYGGPGVQAAPWLVLHYRGLLVHLGRLQYVRARARWSAAGAPFAAGDPVLDLHIPPTGALTPAAVDASFAESRAVFGRVFPADDSGWGVCSSWLLDPQLAEVLPADSNIVRFQRRFHLDDDWSRPGGIVEFVFRRVGTAVADLPPPATTLERAIVDHLASGGQWHSRRGWCEVPG
jgi:GNAT-like C-terminal domain/N-acyltransferase N-terminal domain